MDNHYIITPLIVVHHILETTSLPLLLQTNLWKLEEIKEDYKNIFVKEKCVYVYTRSSVSFENVCFSNVFD